VLGAQHRDGRASRLLRGRDRRRRRRADGGPGGDEPEALELFAHSLAPTDEVALEATANALAIARILEPHVRRVVLANPKAIGDAPRRAKTDEVDARALAQLLAIGFLDRVWTPDEAARTRRRLMSRRCALARQRTRAKDQVHAVLQRNLAPRPPMSDLFGVKGRRWLAERVDGLPFDERLTVEAGLRQRDLVEDEIARVDAVIAADALSCDDALGLMTLPGVSAVTAIALLGAIGDVARFATARHLVAYLGLDPRVRQSARSPPATGASPSRAPGRCAGCSSRRPGTPLAPRGRCAPSTSAWPPAAAPTSPPWPSRASSS
jgi:transposase